MKLKNKRHIVVPLAILVYTIVIAIYFGVKSYSPETKGAFILVISVNLVLALILYFILKKREKLRSNNKK
jgi:nitrogen fixation/metabolism regulation signal transduction histidine kinase